MFSYRPCYYHLHRSTRILQSTEWEKNVIPLNPFAEDLQDRLDCLYFEWIYMVSCNLTASAKNA